mgnify:CR=1 FL=1
MKNTVKTRLEDLLKSSQLSPYELAKRSGIEYTTIQRILNEETKNPSKNTLSAETIARYQVYCRNINWYMAATSIQSITIDEFKIRHAEGLRVWLRTNLKTCSIRHASRHLELLKRVTNYAVIMEYAINDNLSPIEAQRDKPKDIISCCVYICVYLCINITHMANYQTGKRVKELRKHLDLSIIDFASKVGITIATLYRIESGEVEPRKSTLKQISMAFGVPDQWLINGKGDMTITQVTDIQDQWRERLIKEQAERIAFLEQTITNLTQNKK